MANLNSVPSREEEYETQLYGFSSNDLLGHIEVDIQACIKKRASQMEKAIVQASPSHDKKAIEEAMKIWVEKSCLTVKSPLEKLKEQLAAFFSLPPHILAPKDKRQRDMYTQDDEENVKDEINKLKSRIRRAKFLKAVYEEELLKTNQVEQEIKLLDELLGVVKSLEGVNTNEDVLLKNFHKLVQNVLGLEVKEASLKFTDRPSCAENEEVLEEAIYERYKK